MHNTHKNFKDLYEKCKFWIEKSFNPNSKQMALNSNLNAFEHHWKNAEFKSSISSSKPLAFSKYFEFGSSMKLVVNLSGKPSHILESNQFGVAILVYNIRVKSSDVKFELHFQNERLFYINYTYLQISDIEKEHVIQALSNKYQVQINSTEIYNQIILDNEGNGLVIDDTEQFSINYLAPPGLVNAIAITENIFQQEAI
jgi:hypothetical protein